MTENKINLTLRKIAQCKRTKYTLEALISSYHLNLDLVRFILLKTDPAFNLEAKKIKVIVKELQKEAAVNSALKSVINKQSIKSLKVWLGKMDVFFKTLKMQPTKNTHLLLTESEKICAILLISTKKLFVKKVS